MCFQSYSESEFKGDLKELIGLVRMNEQFSAIRAANNMIELDEYSKNMYEVRSEKILLICRKYGIYS